MRQLSDGAVFDEPRDNGAAVTWIRSREWDLCWILSAPVLGLVLVACPALMGWVLWLRFAHSLSPIVLAWSHRDYRTQVMLEQRVKYIGVPIALFALALAVAWLSVSVYPRFIPYRMMLEDLTLGKLLVPIVVWANIYAFWDIYHGSSQDFGIWCLYRRKSVRGCRKLAILAGFVVFYVMLSHGILRIHPGPMTFLYVFGLVTINHQVAGAALCAQVSSRHLGTPWRFIGAISLLGFAGWQAFRWGMATSVPAATVAMSLYAWLGIWHFLQDRWVWKLSNPQVRAAIGKDLFAPPPGAAAEPVVAAKAA
jgi:hypothetical protein